MALSVLSDVSIRVKAQLVVAGATGARIARLYGGL